jgi:hypothetical protein
MRKRLARAATVGDLAEPVRSLDSIAKSSGPSSEAGQLRDVLERIQEAADSSAARATTADLRLFLAGEIARDTLGAPRLAGALFRQVASDWPDSPYAPKALLALGMVDPAWADSAHALLAARYAASPYVAYVQGTAPPEYQALEDSLQAFALGAGSRTERREPKPGENARPGEPTAPGQPAGRRQQPGERNGRAPVRRGLEP